MMSSWRNSVIHSLATHKLVLALSAAGCALALAGGVDAKTTFRPFDPKNMSEIHVVGINDAGTIAGYYNDTGGSPGRGFSRAVDGHFTYIAPKGSQGTFVYAINNKGTTIGWYNGHIRIFPNE
jgi:hypothetical protein